MRNHVKAELFDEKSAKWAVIRDYPLHYYSEHLAKQSKYYRIYGHASIHYKGAFYIFGGEGNSNNIARLDADTYTWSLAGSLNHSSSRIGLSVILDGSILLVVGGRGSFKTEKCLVKKTVITCSEHESSPIVDGFGYPVLFSTPENYNDC